jgi:hypothetical protein
MPHERMPPRFGAAVVVGRAQFIDSARTGAYVFGDTAGSVEES